MQDHEQIIITLSDVSKIVNKVVWGFIIGNLLIVGTGLMIVGSFYAVNKSIKYFQKKWKKYSD